MVFPEAFIKRLKKQDYIDSESLLGALREPSPVSIRLNRRKWDRIPKDAELVPWCSDGYYLKERPSYILDPLFHAGAYYPQEASGMFIEQIFRQIIGPLDNLRILDLCGAPGGKSTHLSSMLNEKNFLVANEIIGARTAILRENLTKWGLANSIVSQSDPAIFGRLPGFFDIILVDAPCSGEGMFRDAVAVAEWSEKNTRLCTDRQKRILMDVWPALKKNGILIYSTCTFNPEENERNIKWFSDQGEFESLKLDVSEFHGITTIDYDGIYGYGFYPGKIKGEGLFISVLRKTEGSSADDRMSKTLSNSRLTKEENGIVERWTLFDPQLTFKNGDEIIASAGLPADIGRLAGKIKITRWGTTICTRKGNSFIPSHELAMSVSYREGSFPVADLEAGQALDYLGRKDLKGVVCNKGWNVFRNCSMNLGFANNIGTRINNYYPAGWRIKYSDQGSVKYKVLDWV